MSTVIRLDVLELYDSVLARNQKLDQEHYADHVKTFFEEFGTRDEFAKKMGLTLPIKNSK